jgi:hypothetical protein
LKAPFLHDPARASAASFQTVLRPQYRQEIANFAGKYFLFCEVEVAEAADSN